PWGGGPTARERWPAAAGEATFPQQRGVNPEHVFPWQFPPGRAFSLAAASGIPSAEHGSVRISASALQST
ncbi:MAG: hypothetical protein K6T86_13060, partial [Pirellulales bacterium]|nr:hypothetical protein [Pirellulales bacterium]